MMIGVDGAEAVALLLVFVGDCWFDIKLRRKLLARISDNGVGAQSSELFS